MAGIVHILPKIGLKQPSIFRVHAVKCNSKRVFDSKQPELI